MIDFNVAVQIPSHYHNTPIHILFLLYIFNYKKCYVNSYEITISHARQLSDIRGNFGCKPFIRSSLTNPKTTDADTLRAQSGVKMQPQRRPYLLYR